MCNCFRFDRANRFGRPDCAIPTQEEEPTFESARVTGNFLMDGLPVVGGTCWADSTSGGGGDGLVGLDEQGNGTEVSALTDEFGNFTLEDIPIGEIEPGNPYFYQVQCVPPPSSHRVLPDQGDPFYPFTPTPQDGELLDLQFSYITEEGGG